MLTSFAGPSCDRPAVLHTGARCPRQSARVPNAASDTAVVAMGCGGGMWRRSAHVVTMRAQYVP